MTTPHLRKSIDLSPLLPSKDLTPAEFIEEWNLLRAAIGFCRISIPWVQVLGGDQVIIAGFIVRGSQPKQVVIRGMGPTLSSTVCQTC